MEAGSSQPVPAVTAVSAEPVVGAAGADARGGRRLAVLDNRGGYVLMPS